MNIIKWKLACLIGVCLINMLGLYYMYIYNLLTLTINILVVSIHTIEMILIIKWKKKKIN